MTSIPKFSCFLIPLTEESQVDTYIPDSKALFLSFFTEEKAEGVDFKYSKIEPILVKCKAFKKNEPGFITLYEVIVKNPQAELFDRNFIVDRLKFFYEFEHHYNYPFIKLKNPQSSLKRKKAIWNHLIILNSININIRLANIYAMCDFTSIHWYMLMTMLISDDLHILPNNLLVYLKNYDFQKNAQGFSFISIDDHVSITGKNIWPILFIRANGSDRVLELTANCKVFVRQFYQRGTHIFNKFNESTKQVKNGRGIAPNMLFYETVLQHFSTPDQIMNMNESEINEVIASYEKELHSFDGKYISELKEFCGRTTKLTRKPTESLLCYSYCDDDASSKLFSSNEPKNFKSILESLKPCYTKVYEHKNFCRGIINNLKTRTSLYEPRKYFLTGAQAIDELKGYLPFKLNTPFVYIPAVQQPKSFLYGNLNSAKTLDLPFIGDTSLAQRISDFLKVPTEENFMAYTSLMYQIITQHGYCFNEQVIANYPVYAMSFDVDITDNNMVEQYYRKESSASISRITKKIQLRKELRQLILVLFRDLLGLEDFESTSNFFMYESLPSAPPISKIGLRFIVRSSKYVIKNSDVMLSVIKALNFLTSFDSFFPGPCFDEAVYRERGHFMRLPMCCKRDKKGSLISPLVPIMVDKTRCYLPSTGLIHHQHKSLRSECFVVSDVPDITECTAVKPLLSHKIIERMIKNKICTPGEKENKNYIMKDYTDVINSKVIPIVKQKLIGMGVDEGCVKSLKLSAERFGVTNRYILADKTEVCVKKRHMNPESNPCKIYASVKKDDSGCVFANCFAHCYGSDCGCTFLTSIYDIS